MTLNTRQALPACLLLVLGGCGMTTSVVEPYRIVIQQGNYVTQDMVAKLRPGMSREQVRFILGTPLLADVFHANRWDYVYYRDAAGAPIEKRTLTVIFDNDRLKHLEGDVVQAGAKDGAGSPAAGRQSAAERKP